MRKLTMATEDPEAFAGCLLRTEWEMRSQQSLHEARLREWQQSSGAGASSSTAPRGASCGRRESSKDPRAGTRGASCGRSGTLKDPRPGSRDPSGGRCGSSKDPRGPSRGRGDRDTASSSQEQQVQEMESGFGSSDYAAQKELIISDLTTPTIHVQTSMVMLLLSQTAMLPVVKT